MDPIKKEIEIVSRLIDGLEYFDGGLCRTNMLLWAKGINGITNFREGIYLDTVIWLHKNLPEPKYSRSFLGFQCNDWSWEPGKVDPRYYWLKDKLTELRKQYNER